MKSPLSITLLVTALVAVGTASAPPAGADHSHDCPSGFEAKKADSGEERAKDRNGDGTVCVKETDDGTDIRDDSHED